MKSVKNFLFIACMALTQSSHAAQDIQNELLILTEKETKLIKTNRVFETLNQILKEIDKAKNWSILHEATTPNRTEAINLHAQSFAHAFQDVITHYATCADVVTKNIIGYEIAPEFHIVDNKETGLKIIGHDDFMKILDKAIKFFETETETKPFVQYTANFLIQAGSQNLTLHEIKKAIERAQV